MSRYTPRESFWRGHWAAIDGTAQPTPNDDAEAYARGAERGAAALAEAMRCKTYRERWAWIASYCRGLGVDGVSGANASGYGVYIFAQREPDR